MALPFNDELSAITNDYFMLEGGKMAVDIYFETSFLLNYLLKQRKGLYERPTGGYQIRVPLEYDGQEAGFYAKGDTISSDDRTSLMSAVFDWKHCYSNATIYRIDGLKNGGPEGMVDLVMQRVKGAQKSITRLLATSIYDLPGGDSKRLTGLRACCHETTTLAYGGIQEAELVSNDGTTPWEGKMDSTTTTLTLNEIRTGATNAKIRDGVGGKPNLVTTTTTNFNTIVDMLQVQQRFTESTETVKAGFVGVYFEGKDIFEDDFCPANHMFFLNTRHIGFFVHREGYFSRTKWAYIADSANDSSMKIYFDGNMVVNNRKAHQGYSAIS